VIAAMGAGWRHSLLRAALLGLGANALASCGAVLIQSPPQTAAVQLSPQPAPVSSPQRSAVLHPARKPTPPPAADSQGPESGNQALAAVGPEPTGPETVTAPQASELIGLDEAAATRLLGEANAQTEQSPDTIWRYKTAACELDLYFYLDLRSGRMRILHYAFKGDAAEPAKRQNCLRDLVAARDS
jgi:hypothetical protein